MTQEEKKAIRSGRICMWVCAAAGLLLFLGTGGLRGSENRWAEIARGMLLTGDWFHPAINGEIYFDKPHLSYWMICVCAEICGGLLNEFMVRLPSALCGAVTLWGVWMLGRKFYKETTANLAFYLTLGSYGFLFWARSGAADMANVAAITLALLWFAECREKAGFFSYLLFYLICFLGALTKGLAALALPLILVIPFLLRDNLWKKHLKWSNLAAFAVAGVLYLLPFYFSAVIPLPEFYTGAVHAEELGTWCCALNKYLPLCEMNGANQHCLTSLGLVARENIVRVIKPFDHDDEGFYAYLYHLPRIAAPWSLFLIAALAGLLANWKKLSPETKSLLYSSGLMFLFFSLSGSRRWYYILPILPLLALLTAAALDGEGRDKWNVWCLLFYRYVLILLGALALASILILPVSGKLLPVPLPAGFLLALPLLGLLVLGVLFSGDVNRGKSMAGYLNLPGRYAAAVMALMICSCGLFSVLMPLLEDFRSERKILLKVRSLATDTVGPERVFMWNNEANATVAYYLGLKRPFKVGFTPEAWVKFCEANRGRKVMLITYSRRRWLDKLALAEKVSPVRFDLNKPDFAEERIPFESEKARKIVIWILEIPEK